jgi:hypothetical protein
MGIAPTHPASRGVGDVTDQSNCRSCGAAIVWLTTSGGKSMPVDAETVGSADLGLFVFGKHRSHFASCPNADQHRKPRKST